MCVSYTVKPQRGWIPPRIKFNRGDIEDAAITQTCYPKNNDSSIDCVIEGPFFNRQCLPAQYFCVHQVLCPVDHVASIRCSTLKLPRKNGELKPLYCSSYCTGKCARAICINSYSMRNKQICGNECFPDFVEVGGSLIRITFNSGQCCQHCGYRFWVSCTPSTQYTEVCKYCNFIKLLCLVKIGLGTRKKCWIFSNVIPIFQLHLMFIVTFFGIIILFSTTHWFTSPCSHSSECTTPLIWCNLLCIIMILVVA